MNSHGNIFLNTSNCFSKFGSSHQFHATSNHLSNYFLQQPEEKIGTGAMGVLENALAAAEDETDVAAAKTAKAEAAADLAEFDESIPIVDQEPTEEVSKAEQEVNNLVQQVSFPTY